jgi:hypothetical protein
LPCFPPRGPVQRIPTATDAIFVMQGMSVGKLSLTKQTKEKTGGRRSAAPGGGEGGAAQPPTQAEKEAEDKLMVTLQVTGELGENPSGFYELLRIRIWICIWIWI